MFDVRRGKAEYLISATGGQNATIFPDVLVSSWQSKYIVFYSPKPGVGIVVVRSGGSGCQGVSELEYLACEKTILRKFAEGSGGERERCRMGWGLIGEHVLLSPFGVG